MMLVFSRSFYSFCDAYVKVEARYLFGVYLEFQLYYYLQSLRLPIRFPVLATKHITFLGQTPKWRSRCTGQITPFCLHLEPLRPPSWPLRFPVTTFHFSLSPPGGSGFHVCTARWYRHVPIRACATPTIGVASRRPILQNQPCSFIHSLRRYGIARSRNAVSKADGQARTVWTST